MMSENNFPGSNKNSSWRKNITSRIFNLLTPSWFGAIQNLPGATFEYDFQMGNAHTRGQVDNLEFNVPSGDAGNMTVRVGHMEVENHLNLLLIPTANPSSVQPSTSVPCVEGGTHSSPSARKEQRQVFKFRRYRSFPKRLQTFKDTNWTPAEQRILAEEGFFSERNRDQATCFCCGLVVDSVGPTNFRTHHVEARRACGFYKHMTTAGTGSTCFDYDDGNCGWMSCVNDDCPLCEWESKMM